MNRFFCRILGGHPWHGGLTHIGPAYTPQRESAFRERCARCSATRILVGPRYGPYTDLREVR